MRQPEERVIVQMITHLKQAGLERAEIFFVGRGAHRGGLRIALAVCRRGGKSLLLLARRQGDEAPPAFADAAVMSCGSWSRMRATRS
jgi:hypothetical protein